MSSTPSSAGAGFTPAAAPAPARIGLTKAASAFGEGLADLLGRAGHAVVGLDERAGRSGTVSWRPGDLAAPTVVRALDDVDVLVHLAVEVDLTAALTEQPAARRVRQVDQVRTLTTAAAAAGVEHLVVVTSTMVFGARADNPLPIPEGSPLRAADVEGLVADLIAVEAELLDVAALHPGLQVTLLRPAALVGPGVDSMITRHFEAPRLLVLRGTRPAWTFCHVEDLATAVSRIAGAGAQVPGQLTVSSWGHLTQAEVEELSGMRRVELSEQAAFSAADRLHRLGVIPVPASDLAFVAHPWTTEPTRLAALGWSPAHDNTACLATLLATVQGHHAVMARRIGSRDALGAAAAGAASAAVAAIATAALLRRRRNRT